MKLNMEKQNNIKKSHSSYVNESKESHSREECKSDVNIISSKNSSSLDQDQVPSLGQAPTKHPPYECQKYKYVYDEIPVKDDGSFNDGCFNEVDSGRGDNNNTIDEIEMKILKKISQELQTDDNSISSLDSNIKIFKTTVNHILDNFYANMQDFELYKKRFHEILEKNRGDSIVEMEDFLKDMIQHIGSSESASDSKFTDVKEDDERSNTQDNGIAKVDLNEACKSNSLNSTIEAFKNENYLTDSTFEQNSSKFNSTGRKDEYLNIFLLSGTRYVEIKMNDRSLFSEINIREERCNSIKEPLASAENMEKLEAKKLELERYVKGQEQNLKDRDIPVKNSNAKKNIHLDEDFLDEDKDECSRKFFIFRICNYICRKIRKNAFG